FLVGSAWLVRLEDRALGGDVTPVAAVTVLAYAGLWLAARARGPAAPVDFDEAPAATQRLELHS
ncbi:MAG: hypothetical protein AB7O28_27120, partial [Vicinamibacterales bacterium]